MNQLSIPPLPKVSVITPSYNQGQFIEETIQSVLAQTYPSIEYIVVDGNSTDNTHCILETYAAHIDHMVIEPDEGQSDAINKGFRLATGHIVGWLNSDDVLLPGTLETVVEQVRRHPRGSIFYGDAIIIDDRGFYLSSLKPPTYLTYQALANGSGLIVQPGSFYPADLVQEVGGLDAKLYMTMDRDLWLRLLQIGNGYHVHRTVACFRRHAGAKNSEPPFRYLDESLRLNRQYPPKLVSRRTVQTTRLRVRCMIARVQHRFLRFRN